MVDFLSYPQKAVYTKDFIPSIFLLLSSILLVLNTYATEITYNRDKAKDYAANHCGTSTDKPYNTTDYKCWNKSKSECNNWGSDCANFASQALINGGIIFSDCINSKYTIKDKASCEKKELSEGTVIIGKDGKTKGVTAATDLGLVLKGSYCFEEKSISGAKAGDILVWNNPYGCAHHVGVVTDATNRYFAAHTSDICPGDTSCKDNRGNFIPCTYIIKGASAILQFPDDKCKKCELDEKTCKAEMKDKANLCQTCDPASGKLTPKCRNVAGGRCGSTVNCDTQTGMCVTSPAGNICADDTFTVGTGFSPGPVPSVSASATAGILEVGYTYDMYALLQSFNEDARIIRPGDLSPELVKDMPLLIIPSAGLYGMENSAFFKAVLEEYVRQGGNILVLSQQHGQAFSIIPGGLGGYGWVEDQHCQTNSSYIDTWHPVLAGQTRSTPSLNVDGYFTKYPENTTILLRRTINGQPAMLMYDYGLGKVIVSSMFSDWGHAHSQATQDNFFI